MCKDCGCGLPGDTPVRIGEGHDHGHGHEHSHDHEHPHEHAHGPGEHHGHSHAHPHTHSHVHGTEAHEHDHAHEHGPGMHHGHDHAHPHSHPHAHAQDSDTDKRTTVEVRRAILEKNDRFAERNRGFFQGRGLLVMNVLSSPGSGKTTLLSETAKALNARLKLGVIVGDLATDNDAQRLRAAGMPVVQITTGTVCHLDAEMVAKALQQLELKGLELLVVENVGNLVCPASYDLGEELRVVLLSVTEGEDKPLKYPPMFQSADLVVISKVDLAEACGWNRELAHANIQRVSPKARVLEVSARKGTGMDRWLEFITASHQKRRVTFP